MQLYAEEQPGQIGILTLAHQPNVYDHTKAPWRVLEREKEIFLLVQILKPFLVWWKLYSSDGRRLSLLL